jgi:peptide/nickel transport system permease protein
MVIAGVIGIAFGIISALYRDTAVDNLILSVSSIFISAPIFVTCFILLLVFSYYLNLLPPSGWAGFDVRYIILPSLALASRSIALIIRIARNEMLSVMKEDYIRTVRALGFPEWRIILIYALKNIIVPVLAVILLDFGAYLGGAVVTESVFSWPGIGRLLIDALFKRDIPVIQGVIIFGTVLFIFIGFILDIMQNMITRKAE